MKKQKSEINKILSITVVYMPTLVRSVLNDDNLKVFRGAKNEFISKKYLENFIF